jgi:prepilin-type N-terminal cleavage/methylation domain-containing protein
VTRALWRRVSWPLLVCALSLVPILGVFTRTRIFYVRDLSFFFYSRHLWLRHALFGGQAPWWDPHVAAGQSAVADAMNQIFMPLTLAVRLLPSDIISFNLWVALPLPLSALGTYLFLRRRALTPGGALTPRSRKTATVRGQSTRADGHSDPQRQHRVDEHSAAAAPTPRDVDLLVEIDKTAPHRGQSTAAALGACAFGLSGVTVSMLNTPNLSWSVAGLPWLLWTVERILQRGARTDFVLAALVVALQALCGEPVTWASSVAVAIAYAAWTATPERRLRVVVVVSAALAGTLLAAVQLVPTMIAGVRAHRGTVGTPDFWSFHPLAAVEFAMPHLFGNYYDAFLADIPWMTVLNSGRDPFYYSVYIGTLVLLLAATGAATRRRQGILWGSIALLFAFAAMGGYTPFYPTLRRLVPPLAYFRFPVKYLAITAFAVAVLAADGWQALGDAGSRRTIARICRAAGTAALIVAALLLVPIAAHAWVWQRAHDLASWLAITRPDAAADFLLRLAPPLGARAAGMLLAGTALLAVAASGGPRARHAAALLFAGVCGDLIITNLDLNLTTEEAKLRPPAIYGQLTSGGRLYIGGRVRGFMNTKDADASQSWKIPAESTAIEGRMELNAELPMAPSGWGLHEALSYDLPVLWPSEYERTVRAFEHAGTRERDAFLRRSGVRWCVLPSARVPTNVSLAEIPHWDMRVLECHPAPQRVFVTTRVKTGADPNWQRAALFNADVADDELRIAAEPPLAGTVEVVKAEQTSIAETRRIAEPPFARIVHDAPNDVIIATMLPGDGYVVLRDSYDPSWRAEVDEAPATIVRANGLYRAVRIRAGSHTIRFHYAPRELQIGLAISAMAALMLTAIGVSGRRRARSSAGFTLIELMIVLAILGIILAIAFARYGNMHARGNEASAIASIRAIAAAQWAFAQTCGHQKYAPTLAALGQPAPATGEAFLSPDLTSGDVVEKEGYQFRITAQPSEDATTATGCNGSTLVSSYAATADPTHPGTSGDRYFAVNADRVMYEDTQTFTANMPETGAPGHGVEIK